MARTLSVLASLLAAFALDHVCANDLFSQRGRYGKLLDAAAKGD